MNSKILIDRELSNKILTIGVSKKTKGGMASVLASYDIYFEKMRIIATWKLTCFKIVKIIYVVKALLHAFILLLFDQRIKIVHIHSAAYASFERKAFFINLTKLMNKKVILHMHAADFKEYYNKSKKQKYIIKIINNCDKLIVLSKSWFQYFQKIGISKSKIEILNNIVSTPRLNMINKVDKKTNFLFLGEIGYRKGIFDLLNAIKSKKKFYKDNIILRIGGNELEGNIKSFLKKEELESFVLYEGWLTGEKKIECLNCADVFILPSYNEGLPIAILEAMSYSLPIISTTVGGIPEVVKNGENGFLIEPGNQRQIQNAMDKFINTPNLIAQFGKISYKNIEPFFPKLVFSHLRRIYQSLL